jgi:choline dehydrogenase-like flavoprotein
VDAPTTPVRATREVIIAAGPVKSPQLLQVSGIGPQSLSESLGVTPIVDLPVGENLQDHAGIRLTYDRK